MGDQAREGGGKLGATRLVRGKGVSKGNQTGRGGHWGNQGSGNKGQPGQWKGQLGVTRLAKGGS